MYKFTNFFTFSSICCRIIMSGSSELFWNLSKGFLSDYYFQRTFTLQNTPLFLDRVFVFITHPDN